MWLRWWPPETRSRGGRLQGVSVTGANTCGKGAEPAYPRPESPGWHFLKMFPSWVQVCLTAHGSPQRLFLVGPHFIWCPELKLSKQNHAIHIGPSGNATLGGGGEQVLPHPESDESDKDQGCPRKAPGRRGGLLSSPSSGQLWRDPWGSQRTEIKIIAKFLSDSGEFRFPSHLSWVCSDWPEEEEEQDFCKLETEAQTSGPAVYSRVATRSQPAITEVRSRQGGHPAIRTAYLKERARNCWIAPGTYNSVSIIFPREKWRTHVRSSAGNGTP